MNWIVRTALNLRVVVVALAAVLMVVGIRSVQETPLDVFPEFAPPLVEIQTEAPGLSTVEVESLVSVPIETALNGTSWLKTLRSKSVLGLSSVVLIFQEGTDLMRALIYLRDSATFTVPRGLKALVDAFGFGGEWHWEIIITASVITTVPMIILFFIAQRKIIDGVASTGLKG